MNTVTIPAREVKLYEFHELSDTAKERALDVACKDASMFFEASFLTDCLTGQLELAGFPGMEVLWSLSYCQGDGVSFKGSLDLDAWAKAYPDTAREFADVLEVADEYGAGFHLEAGNNFYVHHMTMRCEPTCFDSYAYYADVVEQAEKVEARSWQLADIITEQARAVAQELERYGYDYIEYETGPEYAQHGFEDEGTLFLESGEKLDAVEFSLQRTFGEWASYAP